MAVTRPRIIHPLPGMVRRVNGALEEEYSWPRLERVAIADQAYTLQPGVWIAAYTTLTGARTLTLPPSLSLDPGAPVIVKDEAGAAGSHTITVATQGSDTIDGASTASISANYGVLRLYTNGAGGWFTA